MKKPNTQKTFSIQDTAKLIGFPGGEKKFFEWLRNKKYLMPDNIPYQRYLDYNWFEVTQKVIPKANPPFVVTVTRVKINGLASLGKIVYNEFHKCKCP